MHKTPTEALVQLEELERRLDLWNHRPYGFPVWYGRRLQAYRDILSESAGATERVRLDKKQRLLRERESLRRMARTARRLVLPPDHTRRDILVLSSSMYRRSLPDGTAPCAFALHLEQQMGDRIFFVESHVGNLSTEQEPPNALFVDPIYGLPLLALRRCERRWARSSSDPALRAMQRAGQPEASTRALAFRLQYPAARAWLARYRPRAVIVLCAYQQHLAIQLAAKSLGIPVIELQHGVIHESHPGYAFPRWLNPPWRSLPVPDHLVVFGKYFGELLDSRCEYWRGRWSVGGHPWLESTLRRAPRLDAPDICVFSQNHPRVRAGLRQLAIELARDAPAAVRVGLKPHPGETDAADFHAAAYASGVEPIDQFASAYDYLANTRVAVGDCSTVVIEALGFGCLSAAKRSEMWTDAITSLAERGQVTAVDGARDVLALLASSKQPGRASAARDLFGIGEPELDFAKLIEEVVHRTGPNRAAASG